MLFTGQFLAFHHKLTSKRVGDRKKKKRFHIICKRMKKTVGQSSYHSRLKFEYNLLFCCTCVVYFYHQFSLKDYFLVKTWGKNLAVRQKGRKLNLLIGLIKTSVFSTWIFTCTKLVVMIKLVEKNIFLVFEKYF